MLVDGVEVEVLKDGEVRGERVILVDFENPEKQRLAGGESVHRAGRAKHPPAGCGSILERPSHSGNGA